MGTCFVMQPFDRGDFDKRYDDVFSPAIIEAGLEPYRVDRDQSVSIPIDEIEAGIKRSQICLAEITTDNPNVWFELGYTIAIQKGVILVCSDERTSRFPFDIQHRTIISYETGSLQDFTKLRENITARICAVLQKEEQIDKVSKISPVAETEGLSQHEMVALVSIMQNSISFPEGASAYIIKRDMNQAGFTDIAVSLALRSLERKEMIITTLVEDERGEYYSAYSVNSKGEQWLLDNQDKLILREEQ